MKRVILAAAAMLALGVVAGWVWVQLAHPAEWEVRAGGSIVLTEVAAGDRFSVIVVFIAIGAIASLVWAWVASVGLRELGWWLTPLVVLTTTVAAGVAWRLGVVLGPDGPLAAVSPAVGDKIAAKLAIDGVAPFLVWPIAGLLGVLGATWTGPAVLVEDDPIDEPVATAS